MEASPKSVGPGLLPLQIVHFERSVTCNFFVANSAHLLTRAQKEKFEDVSRVKTTIR